MFDMKIEIPCPLDGDPFPFGKFKGTPYEKVPAWYLDLLRDNPLDDHPEVRLYIEKNKKIIDKELEGR